MAGRVPDLEPDGGVWVVLGVGEAFGEKRGADGGGNGGFKGVVDVAVEERGFADALGTEDDDFGWGAVSCS